MPKYLILNVLPDNPQYISQDKTMEMAYIWEVDSEEHLNSKLSKQIAFFDRVRVYEITERLNPILKDINIALVPKKDNTVGIADFQNNV